MAHPPSDPPSGAPSTLRAEPLPAARSDAPAGETKLRQSSQASSASGSVLRVASGDAATSRRAPRFLLDAPPELGPDLLREVSGSIGTAHYDVLRLLYATQRLAQLGTTPEGYDVFEQRRTSVVRSVDSFAESVGATAMMANAVRRAPVWVALQRQDAATYQAWLTGLARERSAGLLAELHRRTIEKLADDERLDLDEQLTLRQFGLEQGLSRIEIDEMFERAVAENPRWTREFPQPIQRRAPNDKRAPIRTLGELASIAETHTDVAVDDILASLISDRLAMWVNLQREGHLPIEDRAVELYHQAAELANSRLDAARVHVLQRVLAWRFLWYTGFRKLQVERAPGDTVLIGSFEELVATAAAHPGGPECAVASSLRNATLTAWLQYFYPEESEALAAAQLAESSLAATDTLSPLATERCYRLLWSMGMTTVQTVKKKTVTAEEALTRRRFTTLRGLSARNLLLPWLEATTSLSIVVPTIEAEARHDATASAALWANGEQGLRLGEREWIEAPSASALESTVLTSPELMTVFGMAVKSGLVDAWVKTVHGTSSTLRATCKDLPVLAAGHVAAWHLGARRAVVLHAGSKAVVIEDLAGLESVAEALFSALDDPAVQATLLSWMRLPVGDRYEPADLLLELGDTTFRSSNLKPIVAPNAAPLGGSGQPESAVWSQILGAMNGPFVFDTASGVFEALERAAANGALQRRVRRIAPDLHNAALERAANYADPNVRIRAYLWGVGHNALRLDTADGVCVVRSVKELLAPEDLRPLVPAIERVFDSGELEGWVSASPFRTKLGELRVIISARNASAEDLLQWQGAPPLAAVIPHVYATYRGVKALEALGATVAAASVPASWSYGPVLPSDEVVAVAPIQVESRGQIPAVLIFTSTAANEVCAAGPVVDTDQADELPAIIEDSYAHAGSVIERSYAAVQLNRVQASTQTMAEVTVLRDPAVQRRALMNASIVFATALATHFFARGIVEAAAFDGSTLFALAFLVGMAALGFVAKVFTFDVTALVPKLLDRDSAAFPPDLAALVGAIACAAATAAWLILPDRDAYLAGAALNDGMLPIAAQSLGVACVFAGFVLFRTTRIGALGMITAGAAVFAAWQYALVVDLSAW